MAPSRAPRAAAVLLLALVHGSGAAAGESDNDTAALGLSEAHPLLDLSSLAYSNLGGAGPDADAGTPEIVYSKALDGGAADLRISAQGIHNNEYTPFNSSRNVNSGAGRQIGTVNLRRGSNADLHFRFVKAHAHSTPARVPQTYVTMFIPDGVESVSVTQYQEFCFPSSSVVRQGKGAGGREMFFAAGSPFQAAGRLGAPPSDASRLKPDEEARAVTFLFEEASVFPVLIRTAQEEGPPSIDFAFSGDAPEECKPGGIGWTIPDCGDDDSWDDWKVQWCCRHSAVACDHTTVTRTYTTVTGTSATQTATSQTTTATTPTATSTSITDVSATTATVTTVTTTTPPITTPMNAVPPKAPDVATPAPTAPEAPAPPVPSPAPADSDGWQVHTDVPVGGSGAASGEPPRGGDAAWAVQLGGYCDGDLSAAAREWCCREQKVGCVPTRALTDVPDPLAAGATAPPQAAGGVPPEPLFRCSTSVRGVDPWREWSEAKLRWCCRWRGVACRGGGAAGIQSKAESGQPKGLPAAGARTLPAAAWAAAAAAGAAAVLGAAAALRAPRSAPRLVGGWARLGGGLGDSDPGRSSPLVARRGPSRAHGASR